MFARKSKRLYPHWAKVKGRIEEMPRKPIHQCECERCKSGDDEHEKEIHHQINVVMSRLDEQQRRWYAAVEANRHGHGGVKLVSKVTGMNEKTIRRGRQELALDLADRPDERIRLPGAGRPATEKKIQPLNNN